MKKRFFSLLLCFTLVCSIFVGCQKSAETQESGSLAATETAAVAKEMLRYGISEGPATINPTNLGDIISYEMVRQCYNGLTEREPDGKVIPGLAEKWELSEDNLSYHFYLRKGVKFHSGNELKASDVKFTFEYDLLPDRDSGSGSYLSSVVGAEEMAAGTATELSGFEIVNDYEFIIHFTEPEIYFPEYCCVESLYIVEQAEVEGQPEDWWLTKSAGTGPYVLKEYVEDEHIIFETNENYWNGVPAIAGIDFEIIPEESTQMQMYENDELDVIAAPTSEIETLKDSPELISYAQSCHTYFGMTQSQYEPFKDIRVRQAISLVISQDDISNKVYAGITCPLYGIIPYGFNGYNDKLTAWENDPEKARNLLEEAGYTKENPLPALDLYTMGWDEDTAAYVKNQLETELGMTVNIELCDRPTLLDKLGNMEAQSYIFGSTAAYGDARALMYTAFTTDGRRNFSGYSNAEYDKIMEETGLMTDVDARNKLYQEAEQLVIDDYGFVPLYTDMSFILCKSYVTDMKVSGLGMDILDTVKITK